MRTVADYRVTIEDESQEPEQVYVSVKCTKRVYHTDDQTLYTESTRESVGHIVRDEVTGYIDAMVKGTFIDIDAELDMVLNNLA